MAGCLHIDSHLIDLNRYFQATHTEGLPVTYSIDQESMIVDPSLETVRESAFEIDSVTGQLTLRIQPTASMHGMFEFDVVATDTSKIHQHTD